MADILKEFLHRRRVALQADHREIMMRLIGLLDWMEHASSIKKTIKGLNEEGQGTLELEELQKITYYSPDKAPRTRDLEDIASFGWALINHMMETHKPLGKLAKECGIQGKHWDDESRSSAALSRYIVPFLDYIEHRLPPSPITSNRKGTGVTPPATLHDSLKRFHAAHRESESACFIMMRFGRTSQHSKIEKAIKSTLAKHGIKGFLARDREFNDDLFSNILTYIHGSAFGIAVFERLETEEFNPNVALEVGYMLGLKKHVLLSKDQTLKALHTDLVGKLYREFDPQNPGSSIPFQIESWLTDKGLA